MQGVLDALVARTPIQTRLALVVAHPDDETIAAGGSLHLMENLLLVHLTDGAPLRLEDHRRAGFDSPAAYAEARESELELALAIAHVRPLRATLGLPDQDAALFMYASAADLARLFAQHGTEVVITHAYEGGHPDHDATAFAVHRAAREMGVSVIEFAGYRAGLDGETVIQRFLPGPPETLVRLDPGEAAHKRVMYDAHKSQANVLSRFSASVERFRCAPDYDFSQPPHSGPLNYENWGWEMTGERWRELARGGTPCAT